MLCNPEHGLTLLTYTEAWELWFSWKKQNLKPRAQDAHIEYRNALSLFFGKLALKSIHAGHIREYQLARSTNRGSLWKRTAGPSLVNHEITALAQMLDFAGLWEPLKKFYQPMRLPSWRPRRVMTYEEEQTLFRIDLNDADIGIGILVAAITLNTTASGTELRNLQLKHVMVVNSSMPELRVPDEAVKNEYRARRIPLNATAKRAVELCYERALRIGSCRPDDYLFPFRISKGSWDVTRPASRSWLTKSWARLRDKTGMQWLRPHDLRHQAITRMLEVGSPEKTVQDIAGHVSRKMMEHYSHIRMPAKLAVLDAIEPSSYAVARPAHFRQAFGERVRKSG